MCVVYDREGMNMSYIQTHAIFKGEYWSNLISIEFKIPCDYGGKQYMKRCV